MDKKQVVIVALLVVAIVLSTASVMMNFSVMNNIHISEAPAVPQNSQVAVTILPTEENTGGGVQNGVG